jgi:hypothetical protein
MPKATAKSSGSTKFLQPIRDVPQRSALLANLRTVWPWLADAGGIAAVIMFRHRRSLPVPCVPNAVIRMIFSKHRVIMEHPGKITLVSKSCYLVRYQNDISPEADATLMYFNRVFNQSNDAENKVLLGIYPRGNPGPRNKM